MTLLQSCILNGEISDYEQIDKIGLDINFHKHKNHGIEFRMFDFENRAEEFVIKIKAVIGHKS